MLANVIGSLHAAGQVARIDATGLAGMIALAEDVHEFERAGAGRARRSPGAHLRKRRR